MILFTFMLAFHGKTAALLSTRAITFETQQLELAVKGNFVYSRLRWQHLRYRP